MIDYAITYGHEFTGRILIGRRKGEIVNKWRVSNMAITSEKEAITYAMNAQFEGTIRPYTQQWFDARPEGVSDEEWKPSTNRKGGFVIRFIGHIIK